MLKEFYGTAICIGSDFPMRNSKALGRTSTMGFPKVFLSSAYLVASSSARLASPTAPAATWAGTVQDEQQKFLLVL